MLQDIKRENRQITKAGIKPTTEILLITPDIAAAWLDNNTGNRHINRAFVMQLARDIKAGNWALTYDAIRFDVERNLLDGQHRLSACIEANKPIESLVVYNLPSYTRDLIDVGRPRRLGDVIGMRGIKNSNLVAAALRIMSVETNTSSMNARQSHSEALALLQKHPELPLHIPYSRSGYPRGFSLPAIGYISYVGWHILQNQARVKAMQEVMKTGIPDYDGDPIHRFRERIIRENAARAGFSRGSITTDRGPGFWTFKLCWNLFAKKEKAAGRLHFLKENVEIDGLDLARDL